MKLLLTGASGFLGKNFLELAQKNLDITAIYNKSEHIENFVKEKKLKNVKLFKCDLTKKREIEKLFAEIGCNFECCIYLAGNVNVPLSIANPAEDLNSNAVALINFLQACNKIERFVYISSAAVYDGNKGPVSTKAKLDPVVPYCISKLATEQYIKFFSNSGKIGSYVIIRFGGAYGKYSEKKFVSKLVDDIFLKGKKIIEVYGDGANIVNVMHVKDAVKALLACLKSKKSNVVCNLGQENMTINEIVKRVAKIFNKSVKIRHIPRIKEQKYIGFRIKADFNDIFNFKPEYSFEAGIKEFAEKLKNEK
ncbi:NAD(P)-dependent oxidoreductase [Candidatus Woesearchaeota archaeon]|nr:NAD(P)-dependent oxidoreductase [Candidatus Woesearchaeota archaeon]